jgi:hypothetical protein
MGSTGVPPVVAGVPAGNTLLADASGHAAGHRPTTTPIQAQFIIHNS